MLWASLVVRWLRIHLPMQGTWVFPSLGQGAKDTRWRKYKDTGKTESWKTVTFPISETGQMTLASF